MRLKTLISAIVFIVVPFTAMAQDNKENLIHELYVKSGLEKQIVQFPGLIQVGFDQAVAADSCLNAMPQSLIAEIRASIKTAFAPEKIKKQYLLNAEKS